MPEQTQTSTHSHTKLFLWLGLLVLVLMGLAALGAVRLMQPTLSEEIRAGEAPRPAYTEEVKQKVAASKGFAALVSYTDSGFEPKAVRIRVGETVRFTNNSSHDLWVAASAANPPGQTGECGARTPDSCRAIVPMDFWEFTFAQRGAWEFTNNLDKSKLGTVTVEAL